MSTKDRQSFISRITASAHAESAAAPQSTKQEGLHEGEGVLQQRIDSAARMRDKKTERRTLLHVPAERCRIWAGNPRRYELLDETQCEDLIVSFRQDGQKDPVTVRPVKDDPAHDYEIVIGTRRHWTARHLGVPLIVQVDETLTDEEAFRLADIENRNRKDVSDYERATNYLEAMKRYYNNHQGELAVALKKGEMWVSRYLDLAKLPKEVVSAYPSIKDIKIEHARKLKPLLKDPKTADKVLDAARAARGQVKTAQELLAKLMEAAKTKKTAAKKKFEIKTGTNKPLLKAEFNKAKGKLTLHLELKNGASDVETQRAVRDALVWAKN